MSGLTIVIAIIFLLLLIGLGVALYFIIRDRKKKPAGSSGGSSGSGSGGGSGGGGGSGSGGSGIFTGQTVSIEAVTNPNTYIALTEECDILGICRDSLKLEPGNGECLPIWKADTVNLDGVETNTLSPGKEEYLCVNKGGLIPAGALALSTFGQSTDGLLCSWTYDSSNKTLCVSPDYCLNDQVAAGPEPKPVTPNYQWNIAPRQNPASCS